MLVTVGTLVVGFAVVAVALEAPWVDWILGSLRTGYSRIPFEGLWAAQGRVQKQARPQLSRSASEIILSALFSQKLSSARKPQ